MENRSRQESHLLPPPSQGGALDLLSYASLLENFGSPTWFRPTKTWLTARHDPVSSPGNLLSEMVAATELHRILALFRGTLFCMSYAAIWKNLGRQGIAPCSAG